MKITELRIGNTLEQGIVHMIHYQKGVLGCTLLDSIISSGPGKFYPIGELKPIPLTGDWFLEKEFYADGHGVSDKHDKFYSMDIMDYKYCFSYASFRNDWGFYQEYTDSPFEVDEGKKHFISCGHKYVHDIENLFFVTQQREFGEEINWDD